MISDYENLILDENTLNLKCPACESKIELEVPFKEKEGSLQSFGCCSSCGTKLLAEIAVKKNLEGKVLYDNKRKIITENEYSELYYRHKYIS